MIYDLIIKGGQIYDGSGDDPFMADIGIKGDRIVSVGVLRDVNAEKVINAEGLFVTPGFIDAHAHSDFTLIADPRAEGKISQGVTTEINGNCGMSGAPLFGGAFERRQDDLKELGITERWHSVREYRDIISRRGTALNFKMLAGHGNIRGAVVGYEDRLPSAAQLNDMSCMLYDALNEGAAGLSTGLIYPPGIYSNTEELVALARVLNKFGSIYTSHMRSEGDSLLESIEEVIKIGNDADVRVHISHIKTAGHSNWHKVESAISAIEDARALGIDITCDRYPYVASSTDLDAIFPQWMFNGGNEMEIKRLCDAETRHRLKKELIEKTNDRSYWDRIVISSVASDANRWMEGKTVSEISKKNDMDPIETVIDILIKERLRIGAIFFSMTDDNLQKFFSLSYCAIGSDSSARCFDGPTKMGKPHPRTFGTFPRFIKSYVKDLRLMTFSEAVRRMTSLTANIFKLSGRGLIKEGKFADIVVLDYEKIQDTATFSDPYNKAKGIEYVIVNGIPVVWEGILTGRLPGKMLT